jgi:type I restriction enzyme S subunit
VSLQSIELGEVMPSRVPSVDPSRHSDETFELWSIPAFDAGAPELLRGSEIGSAKKAVRPDDVLLSRIVPHIRRSWVVERPLNGDRQIASSEWIIFRSEKIHPAYLRHVLVSDGFHGHFMSTVAGVGGSLLRARPEAVKLIKIPLPPLSEQSRIAAILDQANAIRCLRRKVLARLSNLGQAIFFEMFGDPIENRRGWPMGTIRDMLAEAKYGTAQKANSDGKGLPILRMGNLTYDGQIDLSDLKHVELSAKDMSKYTTQPGDILFNRTNSKELVGKTAVVEDSEPMAIAGYLVRARTNQRGNPHYISAYLNSAHGKAVLRNMCNNIVGMANINAQDMQDIVIAVPPTELQNQFAAKLAAISAKRSVFELALRQSETLFASLQHRAFRGEL